MARAHADAGTARRVRHPVSWGMLLKGDHRISSGGGGGRVLWLRLAMSFLFFIARSDEVWAKDGGGVHPTHCLTRTDIAFL